MPNKPLNEAELRPRWHQVHGMPHHGGNPGFGRRILDEN
jgi:hypothetical protein